ncbi:MAG: rod shape-determining protein MreC [Prolixibacteraceae bacterium]|nr:rod shape-determining protein MreC [Prolixibacteraceae bacterium]
MRSLLRFLTRIYFFLFFILLEVFCLILIVNFNNYQKIVFTNSTNNFIGDIYKKSSAFYSIFNLKEINSNLADENTRLRNRLEKIQASDKTDSTFADSAGYIFIATKVISNSVNLRNNYITLDKGTKDGIKTGMGIISPNGIVGIITNVSDHFSMGPTIINKKWKVSAKIKKNNYFGSLSWDGKDYRYAILNEIPIHVKLSIGDTIVTSSYSSVFPEGYLIGEIESFNHKKGYNFYNIKIRLSTNFMTLRHVNIIKNFYFNELENLQKTGDKDENIY